MTTTNNTESFDLTETIIPRSDQLNAEDVLSGPRTVTIERVSKGSADQPVNIHLVEFPGRPFRPSKTVRRILVAAWGPDAAKYVGRRMVIFNDPTVKWGGQEVGGIRIKALSHIDKRLTLALTVTRGQRKPYVVEPLPAGPPRITDAQADEIAARIEKATDRATLDSIVAELKTFDLGQHRARLLELWKGRANTVSNEPETPPADDVQDAPDSYYEDAPPVDGGMFLDPS